MRFESISGLGDYWKPISDGKDLALGILRTHSIFDNFAVLQKNVVHWHQGRVFVNDTVWQAAFAFIVRTRKVTIA